MASNYIKLWILALAAGCGKSDSSTAADPVAATVREIRAVCGNDYREDGPHRGCRLDVDHGAWTGAAEVALHESTRPRSIWIKIAGPSSDVADLRAKALSIIAPVIDTEAEGLLAQALERLYRDDGGEWGAIPRAAKFEIGPASATAFTGVDVAEPWRRTVRIAAYFVERDREPVPPSPDSEFVSSLGEVTDPTLATWMSLCRDDAELERLLGFPVGAPRPSAAAQAAPPDRWTEGDIWVRCAVGHASGTPQPSAIIEVLWAPQTRRVVRMHVAVYGACRSCRGETRRCDDRPDRHAGSAKVHRGAVPGGRRL